MQREIDLGEDSDSAATESFAPTVAGPGPGLGDDAEEFSVSGIFPLPEATFQGDAGDSLEGCSHAARGG